MTRWSPLLLDEAKLDELPALPVRDVVHHHDLLAAQRPSPTSLYQRWEKQQWRADEIVLENDREQLRKLPRAHRAYISSMIHTFIVGEYTGLDLLGPIMNGAPDEADLIFLGTQVADETRHTVLMARLGEELLDMQGRPADLLNQSWQAITPAHRLLSLLESRIVQDLVTHPGDHRRWLRAVTLFHLVTEEVLAIAGQAAMIRLLRGIPGLDGLSTSFTAMTRDESRHVSYGIHALRQGVRDGYAEEICEVIEEAAGLALWIDAVEAPTPLQARNAWTGAQLSARRLARAMRRLELPEQYIRHVTDRALAARPKAAVDPGRHETERERR